MCSVAALHDLNRWLCHAADAGCWLPGWPACTRLAGLVKDVAEDFPDAVVVGSKVCLAFLQNLIHKPFKSQQVKGGDKVRSRLGTLTAARLEAGACMISQPAGWPGSQGHSHGLAHAATGCPSLPLAQWLLSRGSCQPEGAL